MCLENKCNEIGQNQKRSKNLGKQTNPRAINVQATVRIIPSTVPNSNDLSILFFLAKQKRNRKSLFCINKLTGKHKSVMYNF